MGWCQRFVAIVLVSMALAGFGGGEAGAQVVRPWTDAELAKLQENFDRLDRNRDKVLIYEEMVRQQRATFRRMDKDEDQRLRIGEFMGYRSAKADKYLTRRAFELRRWTFYQMDYDLNRLLTLDEFLFKARKNFNSLDANADGVITFKEFSRLPLTRRGGIEPPD